MLESARDSQSASRVSVAIIGNGIAGSSAARRLALTLPDHLSRISIYEIGRGPGGRGATRKTRSIPEFRINHGAPYADISTREGLTLLSSLGKPIQPYTGQRGILDGKTGSVEPQGETDGVRLVVGADGEMAKIASSLILDGHGALLPPIATEYATMIRGLSRGSEPGDPWRLFDKHGDEIGHADWLVVAGSAVAHPRWSDTFGGKPPLVAAASTLGDRGLDQSLAVIAKQTAAPVLTVLLYATGGVAEAWQRLAFDDVMIKHHHVLARISIQPCGPTGCSVVLHSTTRYAHENPGVYGSSSSAARVGDASSSADREQGIIDDMLAALRTIPGMPKIEKSRYAFGPLLHRWGNAFPQGEPVPEALSVCPDSRVAFCGDYVSTSARMGSYECALLSGANVADSLSRRIKGDQ